MKVYRQGVSLWRFLRRIGLAPRHFIWPVGLSLAAAALDGVSLALLIPLAQGVVQMDFGFVQETPVLNDLMEQLPRVGRSQAMSVFIWLVAIIFSAALFKNALKYWAAVSVAQVGRIGTDNLRQLVFARYLGFGKLFFDRSSLGHLNQVLMGYTEQVLKPVVQAHQLLHTIFSLAVYLVIMAAISWKLTLLIVIALPILNYWMRLLTGVIKANSRGLADSLNDINKQTFNILSSVPLVKAYTNERVERENFRRLSGRVAGMEFRMNKSKQLIMPMQESITLTAILMVVVAMAVLVARGEAAATAAFLVYFYVVMNAANTFGGFNRYWGVLAEVEGPLQEIRQVLSDQEKHAVEGGGREFAGLKGEISLKKLEFAYRSDEPVLRGIDLEIKRGQMTAIVGQTGSGKSTLINLLMRFYQQRSGRILFDGVEVEEFTLESLRQQIAWVSQDVQLFNGSLLENVAYGLPDKNELEAEQALKRARLGDLLGRLPEGLNTTIGDRGVQLSGGEKQRVAIARALLKGSEILILDEATSSLDTKTERLIQEAIDEAVSDKTAIVIAHRLTTISHADKIVHMKAGQILEQGTLEELKAKRGEFYQAWEAQKF